MAIVLGLDLSTQSATALVLDTVKGTTVARARAAFGADFPDRGHPEGFLRGGQGGEVHADPLLWLDGLELALDRLAKLTDLSQVDAVSVSGQQHGSVYLAAGYEVALADGNRATSLSAKIAPVLSRRSSPIWMDSSTASECAEIAAALGGDQAVCDLTGSVATMRFTGPQIRRFAKLDPSAWTKTKRVHLVSSFFASVLAGKDAAIDTGDGAGMNLMDIRKGDWAPAALAATAPELAAKLPPVRPGSTVAGGITSPNGIALSPKQDFLYVSEYGGTNVWSFAIAADGSLSAGERSMTLVVPPGKKDSGGDGSTVDALGRLYVTSHAGVQMFDWSGRLGGVIAKPRPDKGVYSCVFAGPGNAYLYVCGGDAVHRRKTLTQAP